MDKSETMHNLYTDLCQVFGELKSSELRTKIDEVIKELHKHTRFAWVAKSQDGWDDKSTCTFQTQKEAYEDMRKAVLEKMKWNTQYDEDFFDDSLIRYEVYFSPDKITHESYSGLYEYKIIRIYEGL